MKIEEGFRCKGVTLKGNQNYGLLILLWPIEMCTIRVSFQNKKPDNLLIIRL
jgi:hypothetical protein